MAASWDELADRLKDKSLKVFSDRAVAGPLYQVTRQNDGDAAKAALKTLQGDFTKGFIVFFITFAILMTVTPDTFLGIAALFILFPVMFFGTFALVAWFRRDTLVTFLTAAKGNFLARASALSAMAERLDLSYVASPGGAPQTLKILSKLNFVSGRLRDLIDTLDENGGLDEAVEAAVASGMLVPDVVVLGGSEAQKARYYRQSALGHAFEDGFEGERNGIRFSAFEWIESVDDAPDKYHLLLVLNAPYRLHGVTQLRSRGTPWSKPVTERELNDVQLVPATFNDHFRLRSTDQVEARTIFNPAVVARILALAHGEPFRAVASGEHLVINFEGQNRFNLLDLQTGAWSDESIRETWSDIADLLTVTDEMAHAFMVRD